jgi:hypothetical protein
MKVGIMQPYFFPYAGHFSLIAQTDQWVVFDETQYTPKTWMNRNRILHQNSGWNWIVAPVANSSIHIKTKDAQILDVEQTRDRTLGKLAHYGNKSRYYKDVIDIVEDTFSLPVNQKSLVELNTRSLKNVCSYLDIPFKYKICSELNINFPSVMSPDDWALVICQSEGYSHYINPVGGRDLFDRQKYRAANIEIQFLETQTLVYTPRGYTYESNLSILDALMWLPPADIKKHIESTSRLID